ncbi:MAG: ABC transporter ATP-binding protein [Pseudolabrys sp.]
MQAALSLSVRGLTVRYGSETVLASVDLPDIRPGGVTAFAGPNGAGKSTLLRAIAGMVRATGEVSYLGRNLLTIGARERANAVGFMPQGVVGTNGLTVLDSIVASLRLFAPAMPSVQCRDAVLSTLDRMGIINLAMRPLGQLSGGQRQLASLSQSLVREPKILLLDEPTSALDLRHQVEVMSVLKSVAQDNRIVVVVLHDLSLAANWADQLIFLHDGRVAGDGKPADVLTPDLLRRVYGVNGSIDRTPDGKSYLAVDGLA